MSAGATLSHSNITLAACQRALALNAATMEHWLVQGCQTASAAMANLVTAQLRGADSEVESISREVHDDVTEAAACAAAAAGSAMSNGIAAVGRMTDLAAQAGTGDRCAVPGRATRKRGARANVPMERVY